MAVRKVWQFVGLRPKVSIVILVASLTAGALIISVYVRDYEHARYTKELFFLAERVRVELRHRTGVEAGSIRELILDAERDPASNRILLMIPAGAIRPALPTDILDGFGNPIRFEAATSTQPARFRSAGSDGVMGTGDDIILNVP